MAAIVAALYSAFFNEEKSAIFLKFGKIDAGNEFDASESAVCLLQHTRKFGAQIGLDSNESNLAKISSICDEKALLLENGKSIQCSFQLVLFHEETGQLVEMIPPDFDDTKRLLCLLGKHANSSFVFIPTKVITNLKNF